MQRRELLRSLSTAALAGAVPGIATAADAIKLKPIGKAQPFDYAWLKGQARSMAGVAYLAPQHNLPAVLRELDYDRYQTIRYRPDHALWAADKLQFQVRLFHAGLFFNEPVHIYEVNGGIAQELAYDPALFDFGRSGVRGERLPKDLGFAGFRVLFHTDPDRDVAAWLGASYFRAVGGDWQYGISSRGLAIDTGLVKGEEFPRFTAFWLEKPRPDSNRLVIYALLDSPSVAGAFRFEIVPGATQVMEVDAALYPRRPIERIGIAPGTSMYMVGENDRRLDEDFRPEIHDSDGLAMQTGGGEWIWRPLVNPTGVRVNTFTDRNPRGFGLLQRDHDFDHYQDDGAYYSRRPSLWVEPKGDWGPGAITLVELSTPDETNDNIVAFWTPEEKPQPGQELLYAYRLYWGREAPVRPRLATVAATRTGIGGVIGRKRTYFSKRFVVDFIGGDLPLLSKDAKVEPIISSSRGQIELATARPLFEINGWRVVFDLKPTDDSIEPIDLRMFLRAGNQVLSETWLYQFTPPPVAERKF